MSAVFIVFWMVARPECMMLVKACVLTGVYLYTQSAADQQDSGKNVSAKRKESSYNGQVRGKKHKLADDSRTT